MNGSLTTSRHTPKLKRVLVVGTDGETFQNLRASLPEDEFDLVAARDAQEAFACLEDRDARVIICNEEVPDMAAEDCLTELRKRSDGAPVLMILSDADADAVLGWLTRGAAAFIGRPVKAARTLGCVKSVIRSSEYLDRDTRSIVVNVPLHGWVELTAPSHTEYLERFQRFFSMLHAARFDELTERQIRTAVYEIGHNAIEWGNRMDIERKIKITYCLFEDRIVFKIEDEGEGFDPGVLPDPSKDPVGMVKQRKAEGKRVGGFGLQLARKVMDLVEISERGNIVLMEKRLGEQES